MALSLTRLMPRRSLALALAIGLVGASVGVVYAKPGGDCRTRIAGTYYKSADVIMSLSPDGTFGGHFSKTVEPSVGIGETFNGIWSCTKDGVTIQEFRFYELGGIEYVQRLDAVGTYVSSSPTDSLSLTFTITVFLDTAAPSDVRSGSGLTQFTIPPIAMARVSSS
jgi:hypothetical protein